MILTIFLSTSHPDTSYQFFESIGLSVQKKMKIEFSRWRLWQPYWISHQDKIVIFYLQVTQILLPSFKWTGLSVLEKKRKIYFQESGHGGYLGFLIGTIFAILPVTLVLYTKFWPIGLSVREKKHKTDFQDSGHDGHLGFPNGTILAILSTSHFDASYQKKRKPKRTNLLNRFRTPPPPLRTPATSIWFFLSEPQRFFLGSSSHGSSGDWVNWLFVNYWAEDVRVGVLRCY